jgi:ATP-dependent protease Clp ATPase subunit
VSHSSKPKPNIDQIVAHTRYVIAENAVARDTGLRGLRTILDDLRSRWNCSDTELQPIFELIHELEGSRRKQAPHLYLVV